MKRREKDAGLERFAQRLRDLQRKETLSNTEVASHLGIDQYRYCRLRKGALKPTEEELDDLGKLFNYHPALLITPLHIPQHVIHQPLCTTHVKGLSPITLPPSTFYNSMSNLVDRYKRDHVLLEPWSTKYSLFVHTIILVYNISSHQSLKRSVQSLVDANLLSPPKEKGARRSRVGPDGELKRSGVAYGKVYSACKDKVRFCFEPNWSSASHCWLKVSDAFCGDPLPRLFRSLVSKIVDGPLSDVRLKRVDVGCDFRLPCERLGVDWSPSRVRLREDKVFSDGFPGSDLRVGCYTRLGANSQPVLICYSKSANRTRVERKLFDLSLGELGGLPCPFGKRA